jgi:hypothetical protein
MAYDEFLGERISKILTEMNCTHSSKKMMGGLCFLVDDKMLCGIHFDKKKQTDLLMARVGVEQYEEALTKEFSHPMDFTGRVMKGYVFVEPEGFDMDEDLIYWLELCIAYNPLAKSSKKKKAKKT